MPGGSRAALRAFNGAAPLKPGRTRVAFPRCQAALRALKGAAQLKQAAGQQERRWHHGPLHALIGVALFEAPRRRLRRRRRRFAYPYPRLRSPPKRPTEIGRSLFGYSELPMGYRMTRRKQQFPTVKFVSQPALTTVRGIVVLVQNTQYGSIHTM